MLKALVLQALYSIPSKTKLMEHTRFNLLYRWFLDLPGDAGWSFGRGSAPPSGPAGESTPDSLITPGTRSGKGSLYVPQSGTPFRNMFGGSCDGHCYGALYRPSVT